MKRRILLFLGFLLFALLVIFLGQLKTGFLETIILFLVVGVLVGFISQFIKR